MSKFASRKFLLALIIIAVLANAAWILKDPAMLEKLANGLLWPFLVYCSGNGVVKIAEVVKAVKEKIS